MKQPTEHRFLASKSSGEVSGLLLRPNDAWCLFVYGHGAGAGMTHTFMESSAVRLAARGVATFRYNFPYIEQGRRRPDFRPKLLATVRSAVVAAGAIVAGGTAGTAGTASGAGGVLPLFAGGKSMGGRMTSGAAAKEALPGVNGLVYFGFPLHPPGKPSIERGDHLDEVDLPMLFLQGTRDKLAGLDLIKSVCRRLGSRAELQLIDGADHGFHVLKRSGRTDEEVLDELAENVTSFCRSHLRT